MSSDQAKSHKNHLRNQGSSPALLACVIFKVYFIAFSHTGKAPFQNYTVFFTAEFSYVNRNVLQFHSHSISANQAFMPIYQTAHAALWFGWNIQERVLSSYSIVNFCFFVNYNVRGSLFGFSHVSRRNVCVFVCVCLVACLHILKYKSVDSNQFILFCVFL